MYNQQRRQIMRSLAVLALCFLFSTAIAIGWTAEPITILERGGYINTRTANKVIWVKIELHPDNRRLAVNCDSGDFYRYGEYQLEGKQKPSMISFEFNLASGEYECMAILSRNTNGKKHEFTTHTSFIIF